MNRRQINIARRRAGAHRRRRRRGTILIVALGVLLILAALVLVLGRSMRVEAIASANYVASVQADSIERGGEQYALAQLLDQADAVLDLPESTWQGIPVGDGYFWIIRPNFGDDALPVWGPIDETAKLNVQNATTAMLELLPGMTPDMAAAVVDWQDADEDVTGSGAESQYYLTLPQPYQCKNSPMETVEEMLLVRGFTRTLLYGQLVAPGPTPGTTGGGGVAGLQGSSIGSQQSSMAMDPILDHGIYDLLTVYSVNPATTTGGGGGGGGQQQSSTRGRINVNTAPREVLRCLPGLDDSDVNAILTARGTAGSDRTDITWFQSALPLTKYTPIRNRVTGQAYQWSADVVAVSGNGRAFKRCRVVIDITNPTAPRILYRRDLTDRGWPLDPQILTSLKNGLGPASGGTTPWAWRSL
jgi:type II secretory pathway component PulK